jgi:hypothetical protein
VFVPVAFRRQEIRMNEQMRQLIAALYQHSTVVPQVAVPSEVFRRLVEAAMKRPSDFEDAKIIKEDQ